MLLSYKATQDVYEYTWKCGELKLYFSPSAGGRKKVTKKGRHLHRGIIGFNDIVEGARRGFCGTVEGAPPLGFNDIPEGEHEAELLSTFRKQ